MKKIFKITVISLSILILVFSVFLFFAYQLLNVEKIKTSLIANLSETLNTEVSLESLSIDISFSKGLSLMLKNLSIKDFPDFSPNDLFQIKSVYLGIDAGKLLTQKQIYIKRIDLQSPQLNVIRLSSGRINIQEMIDRANHKKTLSRPGNHSNPAQNYPLANIQAPVQSSPGGINESLKNMFIRDIVVKQGQLVFNDLMAPEPVKIPVENIDLAISDFYFSKSFPLNLSCSLWSSKNNISLRSRIEINEQDQQITVKSLDILTNLSDISLPLIKENIPSIKNLKLKDLRGLIEILVSQALFNQENLESLSAQIKFKDGSVSTEFLDYPIEHMGVTVDMDKKDIHLKECFMYLASGRVLMKGDVSDYLTDPRLKLQVNIEDLLVQEIISPPRIPVDFTGHLSGEFTSEGQLKNTQTIQDTLKGEGQVEVSEGKVKGINILKAVLDKISIIPNLEDRIMAELPEEYKKKLTAADTEIKEISFKPRIHQGLLLLNNIQVEADGIHLSANGKLDLNQNLSMAAEVFIPKDLSASLARSVEELKALFNENELIYIPLKFYSGKIQNFVMYPDFKYLTKKIMNTKGKDELKKVIFKALDIDQKSKESTTPSDQNQDNSPQDEVSPEQVLIDNVLDAIFK